MDGKVQNTERGERLKAERKRLNKTIIQIAAIGGVSKGSQILYEKGKSPTADYLSSVSDSGVDIIYIITGTRSPILADRTVPLAADVRIGDQEFSAIKVYEVEAAAGNGFVPVSEAVSHEMAFTRSYLMQRGIVADMAAIIRVRGDSMAPTIPDGAYVVVDRRGRADWSAPGIYIIRLDDAIVVKRLQLSPKAEDNWVSLISDNPSYPPIVINEPESPAFEPLGRVRAVIAEI